MRIWKQLLTSLVLLCCGVIAWLWIVPGSAATLEKLGLPKGMIAAVAPREKATGTPRSSGQVDRNDARMPRRTDDR